MALLLAPLGAAALSSLFLAPAAQAADKCILGRVAELPITMAGTRPLIDAKINGRDARFALDSGAFFSMMSKATAAEFDLKLMQAPFGFRVQAIGGVVSPEIATVKEFGIAGTLIRNVQFLVGGSEVGSAGMIGQNFLEQWDVEYDFAKGVVRLFKPEGCKKSRLAYWLTPGQRDSEMPIDPVADARWHTVGEGYVNDQKIRVTFDTGASASILSLQAAAKAGIKIDSPGVTDAGYGHGFGRGMVKYYIATAASFKIGDGEEIKNARLLMADLSSLDTDLLLGSDFFVSHHLFVSNSQHKLYMSYNGGPVFNLANNSPAPPAEAGTTPAPEEPADPDALARRGEASAARHEFEPALADLSKAVELRPDVAEYLYQRAMVYRQSGQPALALADLDHVLTLDHAYLNAYLPRAEIRMREGRTGDALADLDAVDLLAAKQSDLRYALATHYESLGRFPQAIAQFDLWIQNHPDDSRLAEALGTRCWASGMQNQDLAGGLADCNKALRIGDRKMPGYSRLFAARGMVELRQTNYDKSIDDFDAAIKAQPKNAVAFYGRGVAKIRQDKKVQGLADIDEAARINPGIADRFTKFGVTP